MALWARKKSGRKGEDPGDAGGSGPVKERALRPNEMLASVVSESTLGPAVDLLRGNEVFALPQRAAWVALALPVSRIGGLSKKQSKNEEKGSIIELVRAGHIEVIVTPALLDDEVLCIVPTADTLARMSEYSLLTTAAYYWVVIQADEDGGELVIDPVDKASYEDAVAVSTGSTELSEVLPAVWRWALDNSADTPPEGGPANERGGDLTGGAEAVTGPVAVVEQPAPPALQDEEAPFGVEDAQEDTREVDYQEMDASEDEPAGQEEGFDPDEPGEYFEDGSGPGADTGAQDETSIEAGSDRVVPEAEVRTTIARRFLKDDLNLVVDLEGFEATFGTGAPAVLLDVAADPHDWMGSQVAQLVRQANAELGQMYVSHLADLRTSFVTLMSEHTQSVVRAVSTDREGSPYHRLSQAVDTNFAQSKAASGETVSKARTELIAAFEAQADEHAAQVASEARAAFVVRRRPRHEQALAETADAVARRIEADHVHSRQIMLEKRRVDADRRMDLGTTEAFQLLSGRAAEQREAQMDLLQDWTATLSEFVDENRKADVARAQALQEELDRSTVVETLRTEHAARVAALSAEHEARAARLEQEIARAGEQQLIELNERQSAYEYTLGMESAKVRHANELNSALIEQAAQMKLSYDEEYKGRLETLQQDKQSYSDELERANAIQSRANKVLILVVVLMALAALAVGVIIGWNAGFTPSEQATGLPVSAPLGLSGGA